MEQAELSCPRADSRKGPAGPCGQDRRTGISLQGRLFHNSRDYFTQFWVWFIRRDCLGWGGGSSVTIVCSERDSPGTKHHFCTSSVPEAAWPCPASPTHLRMILDGTAHPGHPATPFEAAWPRWDQNLAVGEMFLRSTNVFAFGNFGLKTRSVPLCGRYSARSPLAAGAKRIRVTELPDRGIVPKCSSLERAGWGMRLMM